MRVRHDNLIYFTLTSTILRRNKFQRYCKYACKLHSYVYACVSKRDKKYYTRRGTQNKVNKKYLAWPTTAVCGYSVQRKKNSSFRLFLLPFFVRLVPVLLVRHPSLRSSFVRLSTCVDSRIYIQMNRRGRVDLSTYQTRRGEE